MNWNWQTGPGWNIQVCGAYSVTKHEPAEGSLFYIAWHDKMPLKGNCATADEARQVCREHAEASAK